MNSCREMGGKLRAQPRAPTFERHVKEDDPGKRLRKNRERGVDEIEDNATN